MATYVYVTFVLVMAVYISCASTKEHPKCCLPEVFEVLIGIDAGMNAKNSPGVYQYEYRLYYDYPGQRWGIIQGRHLQNGDWTGMMLMEDYNKQEIRKASEYRCEIMAMPEGWEMTRVCLPDDAVFSETVTMGYGEHSLTYDTWKWSRPIRLDNGEQTTMHVTTGLADDCTFINEVSLWQQEEGGKFNMTNNFAFFDIKVDEISKNNIFRELSDGRRCRKQKLGNVRGDPYRGREMSYLSQRVRHVTYPDDVTQPDETLAADT